MNTKKTIIALTAATLAAVVPMSKAEARPHGGFHGGHHHYSAWGRGGRYFWPGFTGGLVSGALWGAYYRPYYYTTPVVYTTPVATTSYVVQQPAVQQAPVQQTAQPAPAQQAPAQTATPSTLVLPNGSKITTSDPAVIQQYMQIMQNAQQNVKQ